MEYEKRRKEIEEAKKQKRKNSDGTTKKQQKSKKAKAAAAAAAQPVGGFPGPMDQPMGVFDPQNIMDTPPGQLFEGQPPMLMSPEKEKKKQRKTKSKKEKAAAEGQGQENAAHDNLFETLSLQLKQMPPVPLIEPFVGHTYAICSLAGSSPFTNCKSLE